MNGIELTHLRYFIAVAEELHFSRAAARLHMAQPPLTRQIRLLEQRLGCRLFDRTSRSTTLTAPGRLFLEEARRLVAGAERTFSNIRLLGRGEEGPLSVATAPSLMLGELPSRIRAFRKRYPNVQFRLDEMASSAILRAVESGVVDLGLIRGADRHPGIDTLARWTEPMVAILPNGDADLRHQPFVFFPRELGASFYDEVMRKCRKLLGFTPAVTQEARQWSSIVSLVSAGMGVSIGPASVSQLLPKAARYVPLDSFVTTVRLIGRSGQSSPAARNFALQWAA